MRYFKPNTPIIQQILVAQGTVPCATGMGYGYQEILDEAIQLLRNGKKR